MKAIRGMKKALISGALAYALLTGCDEFSKPIVGPATDNPEMWALYWHIPAYRQAYYEQYGYPRESPRPIENTDLPTQTYRSSPDYNIEQEAIEGEPRWAYTFFRGERQLETITICGSDAKDLIDDHTGPLYDFMKQLDRLDGTDGEITETAARQYRNK